jgi:hypothetical protein
MSDYAKVVSAESGDRPTVAEILSGGASDAEKFRDLLGTPLEISELITVQTKNGESIQFVGTDDDGVEHLVWAPSIVAKNLGALEENGYLPIRLIPSETESKNGRAYFTLEVPENEPDGA